ncbi:MAG TPA: hypothetical protein VID70_02565 [Solirubrobacteraceae bacterium]|jgi:hypothetical protein
MNLFPSLLASSAPPARGAPIGDLLWASAVATVISVIVLWVAAAHRAGRITWLSTAAQRAQRMTGLPGWAALPLLVTGAAQGIAVFGFYWDVAKHIDTGRDPGPFGTAAHYPILVGLAGITLGGFLAIVLGSDEQRSADKALAYGETPATPAASPASASGFPSKTSSPGSVRLARDWHAPLGGLLIFLCGASALIGFPLDDVWHTLFGQDVTLWGPTHVLMILGASLSVLGCWVLLVEGARARTSTRPNAAQRALLRWREIALAGAFLIALSTLQGEFDYGIPQFQLVYQPILIAFACGAGLVAARVRLGRGGALGAALFYLAVYGLLSLVISQVIGASTLHFPLYLPAALLVELVALFLERPRAGTVGRSVRARPVLFGAASGVLVGTLGLAAEWGWSHVWMPLPWPSSMLAQVAVLGPLAALAGGVLGGCVGDALDRGRSAIPACTAPPAWVAGLAGALAIACIAWPLPMTAGTPMTATARLTPLSGGAHRTVAATFHLSPTSAAEGAQWVTVTAWQGGGLVVDRLRRTAPGVYVSTEPIPVGGKWKTMLRIARGRALDALPIYMPDDPAIPAAEVPAPSTFTRAFVRDKKIMQREAIGGDLWLAIPAYLLLLAIVTLWIAALAWGLGRLGLPREERTAGAPARPKKPAGTVARVTG